MTRRQIIGWLTIAVGILFIILAIHWMNEFAKSKGLSSDVNHFFTQNPLWNPIIKFFKGKPQEKAPDYDLTALITQIVGIVLVALGSVLAFSRRKN